MSNTILSAATGTLTLNQYIFSHFAEGDYIVIAPVNPATSRKNAPNGVTVAPRSDGDVHTLTMRVQRNSPDHKQLNSWARQGSPAILNGSFKENYTQDGLAFVDTWALEQGSVITKPTRTGNSQDTNDLVEYVLEFRNATNNP